MNFSEYQKQSRVTAVYPRAGEDFTIPLIGLCGETGELADKLKKLLYYEDQVLNDAKRKEIQKEIGDVLWYVSQLATELSIDLDETATNNIKKILERKEAGTLIKGEGDNR